MISRFNVLALESDPRYEGSEYTTRVFMSIKPARDLNVGESVSERLRKLEEILATPRAADSSHATADAADSMLSFVMTDRIRRMTAELARLHHGEIDAVVQISSPKGVARALQRVGRSGHLVGQTSHGLDTHAFMIDARQYGPTAPGKTLTLSAPTITPGVFMYHCAAGPVTDLHIKSGIHGAMIVYPRAERLRAAREIVIVEHAVFGAREFVDGGGLMSYGLSYVESYRQAASYVDKVLAGAKPASLPVQQPTRFELVVNLAAAKSLGIAIPPSLQARADDIIR